MIKVIPVHGYMLGLLSHLPPWWIYAAPSTVALLFFFFKWIRSWKLSGRGSGLFMLAVLALITGIAAL